MVPPGEYVRVAGSTTKLNDLIIKEFRPRSRGLKLLRLADGSLRLASRLKPWLTN